MTSGKLTSPAIAPPGGLSQSGLHWVQRQPALQEVPWLNVPPEKNHPKGETILKSQLRTMIPAAALALALILSWNSGAPPVSASDDRNGQIHLQKNCEPYHGQAGEHCTVTMSNLAEIPPGSNIYYDQAAGVPAGLLDSNIVLDTGNGSRGVGRCTLDFATHLGLCTFSDETGKLAKFTARVNVSFLGGTLWAWNGTYRFSPLPFR